MNTLPPQLKAALQEIALGHSQGMYMHNPDGEFVSVNAEALAAQLESELQPEVERWVMEAKVNGIAEGFDEGVAMAVECAKTAYGTGERIKQRVLSEPTQLTQSNQKEPNQ